MERRALFTSGNRRTHLRSAEQWVKNRKVSSASFILTCLAVGTIIKMWVTLLGSFTVGLFSHLCATSKLAKVITLWGALMNHLEMNRDHSDVFEIACCESAAVNMPANLEKSAVATGLEKVCFHSNTKESNAKECSNYCTMALISHASMEKAMVTHSRLLPGKSHGWRSLVGCSLWGH